jgi:hypothetical protein
MAQTLDYVLSCRQSADVTIGMWARSSPLHLRAFPDRAAAEACSLAARSGDKARLDDGLREYR